MSLLHWDETVMVEQKNAGQIYEVTVESASIASVMTKHVQADFVEGRVTIARPNGADPDSSEMTARRSGVRSRRRAIADNAGNS